MKQGLKVWNKMFVMLRVLIFMVLFVSTVTIVDAEEISTLPTSGKCGDNAMWVLDADGTFTVTGFGAMYDYDWNDAFHDNMDGVPDWNKHLETSGEGTTYVCVGSENIHKVVIGSGITHIGNAAFAFSNNLTEIVFGQNVESIGEDAFYGCDVEELTIPGNVKTVGANAFDYSLLKSVVMLDGVEEIAFGAFWRCESLEQVTIPSSVSVIGYRAFEGSKWIENITDEDGFAIVNNILIDSTSSKNGNVVIPDGITSIQGNGLSQSNMTSVKIPESVTYIGDSTFSYNSLSELNLPSSLEYIGKDAFYWCSIGNTLTEIQIPASVAYIGPGAFNNVREDGEDIQNISVAADNVNYDMRDDCHAIIEKNTNTLIFGNKYSSVPETVTAIGESAFAGANIEEIDLTNITKIGINAFRGATLKSVVLPDAVTEIPKWAFVYCSSLENITLSPYTTRIGQAAFYGTAINSIELPDSITYIDDGAFEHCEGLKEIVLPDNLTYIGEEAFFACDLISVSIPENVEFIGNCAFACNDNIENFEILNYSGIKKMQSPFSGNTYSKLKTITFYNCDFGKWVDGHIYSIEGSNKIGEDNVETADFDWTSLFDAAWNINSGGDSIVNLYARSKEEVENGVKNPDPEDGDTGSEDKTDDTPDNTNTPPVGDDNNPPAPPTASVPAAKGSVLQVTDLQCKVKVLSGDVSNPSVAYAGTTNKNTKIIKVPDAVTVNGVTYKVINIADKAFSGNKKIKSVIIGKNVTAIGKNAFKNCSKLKTVEIKSKVLNKIGANAFSGNKGLTKITLKTTKLTKNSIGKNALKGTNKKLVIKAPKSKVKAYQKYFKNKGNKSVKVKK